MKNSLIVSFFLLFIVFFGSIIAVGYNAAAITTLALLLGLLGVFCFNKKHINLYSILFAAGWLYLVLCYLYMKSHNFSWLLAFDAGNVFVPDTEKLLGRGGKSYFDILKEIFSDFQFFSQELYGYWAYLTFWGLLSNAFGVDLYYTLQLSTLFVFPFVGICLDKLLTENGIEESRSFKYTILICLFSIIFFYSSQILRDIHILLFYLIAIRISIREELKLSNIVKLIIIIFITCLFRIESGLFLVVAIPIYLLVTLHNSKHFAISVVVSVIILALGIAVFITNSQLILLLADSTYDGYIAGVQDSTGVIGSLQKIPIIGSILSIFYNAFQPVPFWRCLSSTYNDLFEGAAAFNIMNITRLSASFVNVMTSVFILGWLFSKSIRNNLKGKIGKPIKYHMIAGFVFLYIQSAVIDQRRMMGYYCLFYIVFFIIYHYLDAKRRSSLMEISFFLFFMIQLAGSILELIH